MLSFMKTVITRIQTQSTILPKVQILCTKSSPFLSHSMRFNSHKENMDTEKIMEELCGEDKEREKKLRLIMLEVDVMRQDGRRAPQNMELRFWEHLLELPTRTQRNSYILYLWKREMSRLNDKAKKEQKKLLPRTPVEKDNYDDQEYGLMHQSIFVRIRDPSINDFDNYRALQAIQFGQPLVLDCSYGEHMVPREALNAAKQATFVFGENRIHQEPFNLHMCNVDMNGKFMKQLEINIPVVNEPWFPMHVNECSYLDLFPKEKLVYLTPHCRNELRTFDHDAVYIVGCMVDKVNNEPLSLAKAKREGLKMAKLPLDRYLDWATGSKTLNINHMVSILLDLKVTGDWQKALKHVPKRKLIESKMGSVQHKLNQRVLNDIVKLRKHSKGFTKKEYRKHALFDDGSSK